MNILQFQNSSSPSSVTQNYFKGFNGLMSTERGVTLSENMLVLHNVDV